MWRYQLQGSKLLPYFFYIDNLSAYPRWWQKAPAWRTSQLLPQMEFPKQCPNQGMPKTIVYRVWSPSTCQRFLPATQRSRKGIWPPSCWKDLRASGSQANIKKNQLIPNPNLKRLPKKILPKSIGSFLSIWITKVLCCGHTWNIHRRWMTWPWWIDKNKFVCRYFLLPID